MEKREIWWPEKRRFRLVLSLGQTVLGGCAAAFKLADGRLMLGILAVGLALCGAFLALEAARTRVETSAEGIRVVRAFTATWIPWKDVAEVRPNVRPPWGDLLVVVKRDGDIVKLPLPPTDEVVQRWKHAASPPVQEKSV